MCADRNRLEDDTEDGSTDLTLVAEPVIDLTDERRAARVDHEAGVAARVEAVALMREASELFAAATAANDEAQVARDHAARVHADAAIDELTGALRRSHGFQAIRRDIDRARRGDGLLVLGFLDVDGLKHVNDNHGHLAGDALLRNVVSALRASLRSYDVVVRYGGDEFVYSLSGSDLESARKRFATMCALLAAHADGRTVSGGFASLRPGDDLDALIRRADHDLYACRGRPLGPGAGD